LDGLRGIAILSVLLWHSVFDASANSKLLSPVEGTTGVSWALRLGGLSWSGVDLFFVLSGFLIGGILLDAAESSNYYRTFYIRRAFRILPLYGLVVGLLFSAHFLVFFLTGNSDHFQSSIPWVMYPTFTQNFWMARAGWWGSHFLGPTWSLAIEEQFYLTAPFIMRRLTRHQLAAALGAVVVGAPLLRAALLFRLPHGAFAAYVLTPCRADALSLGILIALLVRDFRCWAFITSRRSLVYAATAGLFAVLFWLAKANSDPFSLPMICAGYSVLALFYSGCLLTALLHTRVGDTVLGARGLVRTGQVAYCAYLIHTALIQTGRRAFEVCFSHWNIHFRHSDGVAILLGGLFGVVMTLVLAGLSWRFFEQPLIKRGQTHKY